MRVFVWDDVLESYAGGMVMVVARDEAHARELLVERSDYAWDGEPREIDLSAPGLVERVHEE